MTVYAYVMQFDIQSTLHSVNVHSVNFAFSERKFRLRSAFTECDVDCISFGRSHCSYDANLMRSGVRVQPDKFTSRPYTASLSTAIVRSMQTVNKYNNKRACPKPLSPSCALCIRTLMRSARPHNELSREALDGCRKRTCVRAFFGGRLRMKFRFGGSANSTCSLTMLRLGLENSSALSTIDTMFLCS